MPGQFARNDQAPHIVVSFEAEDFARLVDRHSLPVDGGSLFAVTTICASLLDDFQQDVVTE